jgi:acetyltransferase-like isoleucine patch superfamily enzyme
MIVLDFIESVLRNLDGRLGRYLRYNYYRRRLKHCGKGVSIDCGVYLVNPSRICLGEKVWLDKNVILIAGEMNLEGKKFRLIENMRFTGETGEIYIGAHSHVGIGTIIQGHGGVYIEKYFTSSAGCKIYSVSNDEKECRTGTMINEGYIIHPVSIGENVWLGLHAIVLGHNIGNNAFVKSNSVISRDLDPGITYDGQTQQQKSRF